MSNIYTSITKAQEDGYEIVKDERSGIRQGDLYLNPDRMILTELITPQFSLVGNYDLIMRKKRKAPSCIMLALEDDYYLFSPHFALSNTEKVKEDDLILNINDMTLRYPKPDEIGIKRSSFLILFAKRP